MSLTLHVTVARRTRECLRGYVEDAIIEDVQDVQAGKPAAGVARAGFEDGFKRFLAQMDRFDLEFVIGHFCSMGFLVFQEPTAFKRTIESVLSTISAAKFVQGLD